MALLERAPTVDNKYHSNILRRNIEDHLTILRANVEAHAIPSATGLKYRDNYYGLLAYLTVPARYRYIALRVNKLMNPKQCGHVTTVYLPDFKVVDNMLSTATIAERDLF